MEEIVPLYEIRLGASNASSEHATAVQHHAMLLVLALRPASLSGSRRLMRDYEVSQHAEYTCDGLTWRHGRLELSTRYLECEVCACHGYLASRYTSDPSAWTCVLIHSPDAGGGSRFGNRNTPSPHPCGITRRPGHSKLSNRCLEYEVSMSCDHQPLLCRVIRSWPVELTIK